jgi:hypothetical protein
MSMAAAITVAGLSSVANAGLLENAIEDVEISGKVYVEFLSNQNKLTKQTTSQSDIDTELTIKAPVNDQVTSIVTIEGDNGSIDRGNDDGSDTNKTAAASLGVKKAYLAYTSNGISGNVGRFGLSTPYTDGDRVDGFSASYNLNPVTLTGLYAITNDDVEADNLAYFEAKTSVSNVNANLNYFTGLEAKSTGLSVTTSVANVDLGAHYATSKFDDKNLKDGSTLKITASTTVGGISISGNYYKTGKDSAAVTSAIEAAYAYELSQLVLGGNVNKIGFDQTAQLNSDTTIMGLGVSKSVDKNTYYVNYASATAKDNAGDAKATELRLRAKSALSDNFALTATYSIYKKETGSTVEKEQPSNTKKTTNSQLPYISPISTIATDVHTLTPLQ